MKSGFRAMPGALFRASALLSALACWHCATPHMALHSDLVSEASEMPVKGAHGFSVFKKQIVHFGPYRADHIHRGWIRGGKFSIDKYSKEDKRQGYSFQLDSNQGAPWHCECTQTFQTQDLSLSKSKFSETSLNLHENHHLECAFRSPDSASVWNLTLTDNGRNALEGTLTGANRSIRIEPTREIMEHNIPILVPVVGYHFLSADTPPQCFAAVETSYEQKFWLRPGDGTNLGVPLAAASTAILLRQQLEKTDN